MRIITRASDPREFVALERAFAAAWITGNPKQDLKSLPSVVLDNRSSKSAKRYNSWQNYSTHVKKTYFPMLKPTNIKDLEILFDTYAKWNSGESDINYISDPRLRAYMEDEEAGRIYDVKMTMTISGQSDFTESFNAMAWWIPSAERTQIESLVTVFTTAMQLNPKEDKVPAKEEQKNRIVTARSDANDFANLEVAFIAGFSADPITVGRDINSGFEMTEQKGKSTSGLYNAVAHVVAHFRELFKKRLSLGDHAETDAALLNDLFDDFSSYVRPEDGNKFVSRPGFACFIRDTVSNQVFHVKFSIVVERGIGNNFKGFFTSVAHHIKDVEEVDPISILDILRRRRPDRPAEDDEASGDNENGDDNDEDDNDEDDNGYSTPPPPEEGPASRTRSSSKK